MALLSHALRMLTHEPGTTFRVIAPALLIVIGSAVAAVVLAPDALLSLQADPENFVSLPRSSKFLLLNNLALILTLLWLGLYRLLILGMPRKNA